MVTHRGHIPASPAPSTWPAPTNHTAGLGTSNFVSATSKKLRQRAHSGIRCGYTVAATMAATMAIRAGSASAPLECQVQAGIGSPWLHPMQYLLSQRLFSPIMLMRLKPLDPRRHSAMQFRWFAIMAARPHVVTTLPESVGQVPDKPKADASATNQRPRSLSSCGAPE